MKTKVATQGNSQAKKRQVDTTQHRLQPSTTVNTTNAARTNLFGTFGSKKSSWRPVSYEIATWIIFGTFTILACVDRFTWNVWPRQTYSIGSGTAGSDRLVGYKPGPWSVKAYDVLARISGRFAICCFNLLLITRLRSLERGLGSSLLINKYIVDCRDIVNANLRLHRWNAIALCVLTFLHVWSILLPCVTHGWSAQVVPGTFEYILSERKPPGFKDADPEAEMMSLQVDDVFRMVEMTILLGILTPLSVRWLCTRWHAGMPLHRFIMVVYFVDIVRRHTHPHSWILNTPIFCIWLLDKVYCKYMHGCFLPKVHREKLGKDYVVLYWNHKHGQEASETLIGPDYALRLTDSSFLEDPHLFTTFANRHKKPLVLVGNDGIDTITHFEWSVGTVIRVFRNKRVPQLGKKDSYSHTGRLYDTTSLKINAWGPYQGEMSSHIYHALMDHSTPVILVAAGSGVGYTIDALLWIAKHPSLLKHCDLTILFSTRSVQLFEWTKGQFYCIESHCRGQRPLQMENVRVALALTGNNKVAESSNRSVSSPQWATIDASGKTWTMEDASDPMELRDTPCIVEFGHSTQTRPENPPSIPEEKPSSSKKKKKRKKKKKKSRRIKDDLEGNSVVSTVYGRHIFSDEIKEGSIVFCQGSGGLKAQVKATCRLRKAKFFAGLGGEGGGG